MAASVCFDLRQADVRLGAAGRVAALTGVSLQIASGERVALVGANGSGKSTLLRTLHGLQHIKAGVLSKPDGQREAMLFQRPHMLRLSVLHNIVLGLWLQGVPWALARERAPLALARVGMQALAGRSARALSGGQQQRLALARAWALQPDVWLLDEPTASLDPHAKREVEALIAEFTTVAALAAGRIWNAGSENRPQRGQFLPDSQALNSVLGQENGEKWTAAINLEPATSKPDRLGAGRHPPTLVFSSHNLGQVKRLASRVVYLERGQVLADLPVNDFFNQAHLKARSPQAHLFVKGETT